MSSLDLFHPIGLADFIQFDEERYPGTFHLRVYFAKAALPHPAAGTVCHEFGALGFERVIRDRGTLVNAADVSASIVFTGDQHSNSHKVTV